MKSKTPANALLTVIILTITAAIAGIHYLEPATASATQQESPSAKLKHLDPKVLLLELTNIQRLRADLQPLKLGRNPAPQVHAQKALEGCYNSHWDRWGLKPYHRLALTGGAGYNLENVLGLNHCVKKGDGYASLKPIHREIEEAVQAWMNSPGHRAAILNPAMTTIHIGIAHDSHNIRMVQHFETEYISYSQEPRIQPDGTLHIQGSIKDATFLENHTAVLNIGYEPPPSQLERGQLAGTHSLCIPTLVAQVHRPQPHNSSLKHVTYGVSTPGCNDPALIDPGAQAPTTPEESNTAWAQAKKAATSQAPTQSRARHINAQAYSSENQRFQITADLSPVLQQHGPGIYSIMLLGKPDHTENPSILTIQPIFWQTDPPADHPYTGEQRRIKPTAQQGSKTK